MVDLPGSSMPPPPAVVRAPVRLAVTGAAGRVNDLLTGSRLLTADDPVTIAATERLARPFTAVFVGAANPAVASVVASVMPRDDLVVRHVGTPDDDAVASADVVVVVVGAGEPDPAAVLTALSARLKAAEAGPYAIEAVVVGADAAACAATRDAVLATPVGQTLVPQIAIADQSALAALRSFVTTLADIRGIAFLESADSELVTLGEELRRWRL
ncbi:MAG TPA: hypothetical protein PLV68_01645, partial [Ilumatobacteraceae bacterium]|nr:hypothetical protein [Ilumatobacteraceae bacterium]